MDFHEARRRITEALHRSWALHPSPAPVLREFLAGYVQRAGYPIRAASPRSAAELLAGREGEMVVFDAAFEDGPWRFQVRRGETSLEIEEVPWDGCSTAEHPDLPALSRHIANRLVCGLFGAQLKQEDDDDCRLLYGDELEVPGG